MNLKLTVNEKAKLVLGLMRQFREERLEWLATSADDPPETIAQEAEAEAIVKALERFR